VTSPAGSWSALHHGIEPSGVPMLGSWLRLMWWLARPVARVPPIAFTVLGVLLALVAALLAGPLPWAALALVLGAVLCDGLDGAVAVLANRATRWGAAADAVADRVSDAAFAAVLWQCGAPWWLALGCGLLALAVDLLRRARRVPSRITVAERPTWTVCTVLACGSAGVTSAEWPVTVCAGVWAAAGVAGLVQLSR
jgi:CDP-diacylglycerol--glycerol-3-phosphate 3-phosphatidyltransferase